VVVNQAGIAHIDPVVSRRSDSAAPKPFQVALAAE
jgi:hypothetical protein